MPTGRGATCARICRPSLAAALKASSDWRQASGSPAGIWMRVYDSGRPLRSASRRISANSERASPIGAGMIWNTPLPASFRPSASAASSSSSENRLGASSPALVRCSMLREVLTPSAPARMASAVRRRICDRSSAEGGSWPAARSPITNTRSAECGSWAATSTSKLRASSASRYWGKVSQFQGRPSVITTSGTSSTPSMTLTRMSRCSGLQGAKPTPQLPMTTEVTPCPDDGASRFSQVACPS